MVSETWSDLLPSAIKVPYAAYRHRLAIQGWYKKGLVALNMGKADIAVLGRQNVGKSTFVACLRGLPADLDFEKPERSLKDESAVLFFKKKPYIVRTIPGQDTNTRLNSLDKIFARGKSLKAVIYCADWGYTDVREAPLKAAMINDLQIDTVEKRRSSSIEEEIDNFNETTKKIRQYIARTDEKIALILCVGKCDLYYNEIDDAQKHYDPTLTNRFSQIIKSAKQHIGEKLIVASTPISVWPEDLNWGTETVSSSISEDQKRATLKVFAQRFSNLMDECHG